MDVHGARLFEQKCSLQFSLVKTEIDCLRIHQDEVRGESTAQKNFYSYKSIAQFVCSGVHLFLYCVV